MKKLFILFLLGFCLSGFGIDMAMSSTVFMGKIEGKAYLETYISYELFAMGIIENDDGTKETSFTFNYQLLELDGKVVDTFTVERNLILPDHLNPPYDNMDLIPIAVDAGEYHVIVTLTDKEGNSASGESFNSAPEYWKSTDNHMSDIFQIGSIGDPDSSVFVRYGRKFLPYPRRKYNPTFPLLRWIVEFYNTAEGDSIDIAIFKTDSTLVKSFERKEVSVSDIEISGFNIGGFAQGEYVLQINLVDKNGEIKDKKFTPFAFSREKKEEIIDEDYLALINEMLVYLVSSNDVTRFQALSPSGKMRFWERFWSEQTAGTKDKFIENWNYVSRTYETEPGASNGHKTDMGEIYLRFGEPDFQDTHALSSSSNPWEEWTYISGMNAGFVIFGDVMNIDKMTILSSDLPGYIEDENWRRKISRDHKADPQSNW